MPISLAIAVGLASGCATAASTPEVPPRPNLPAVDFVKPCDPSAAVGLTPQGVENLKQRDAAWRTYTQRLEALLRFPP